MEDMGMIQFETIKDKHGNDMLVGKLPISYMLEGANEFTYIELVRAHPVPVNEPEYLEDHMRFITRLLLEDVYNIILTQWIKLTDDKGNEIHERICSLNIYKKEDWQRSKEAT